MALKRVTMQDIADACGLSRNTVSKVFNGRGIVPESTQKMVLAKAQELGYHQLPSASNRNAREAQGSIALLTQHKLLNHGFGSVFMTSFTDQLSRAGFSLKIFEISPQELAARQLPPRLDLDDTLGFLGIELFDKQYLDLICSLNKPTVFVDAHAHACRDLLSCDVISMENTGNEHLLVTRMIKAGAKRIGFVGDIEHCNSFYERWVGYFLALRDAGLELDQSLCILADDSEDYGNTDWILQQLANMPSLPDAFACANDFLAIHLMTALKRLGLSIPSDIMVCGFDGSIEAGLYDPPLSTALIPGEDIGRLAATVLTARIQDPGRPYFWTYVKSTPIQGNTIR